MIFREVAAAAVAMLIRGRFYRQQLGSRPNNFPAKLPTYCHQKRNLAIESGTYIVCGSAFYWRTDTAVSSAFWVFRSAWRGSFSAFCGESENRTVVPF